MTSATIYEDLYTESRNVICTLVRPENQATIVPACPLWTLHDLVCHLTGLAEDFASDNLRGAGSADWTAAQVERCREHSLEDIFTAWMNATERLFARYSPLGRQFLGDIVAHEFDVRGALGNTNARDAPAMRESLDQYLHWTHERFQRERVPPLSIRFDNKQPRLGDGVPACELELSPFELFRVLSGRRSTAQILGYQWSGDPAPWLHNLAPFDNCETDLIE